ncbi:aldo/keto reductase [Candidatus Nomurabacteria bacterium]|nr:aldo/keto reductase [Candidatus Nomurabacteria bacterium]
MIYKEYGHTGIKVSALGFGGMRFRSEEYMKDPEICAEVVKYANSKGINYFDTAPGYCDDMSEVIYGYAFKDMPGKFYVATKSSYWSDKTSDDVRRRCEESLNRMNVESIDFYQMWSIMNLAHYRNVMAPGGPYEGAMKLKEEGLVKHICLSTHAGGSEIKEIVDEGAFEGILLGYNATNFAFRQEGVKAAYDRRMGVITMNPLGGGTIPQNPEFYSFLIENENETVAQAALRFNISHKEITVTLSGMGSKSEVDENILAANEYTELSDQRMEDIKRHLYSSLNDMCTGCGYCEGCPMEIPIPRMMDSYNMKILSGEEQEITNRLKYHWGIKAKLAAECIECGQCEERCTQHLPIIERLKEIANLK